VKRNLLTCDKNHFAAKLFRSGLRSRFALFICSLSVVASVFVAGLAASNGVRPPGYSGRYGGMGGLSLAVGGTVLDLESNPAQLAKLQNSYIETGLALVDLEFTLQDQFYSENPGLAYTNRVKSNDPARPFPYAGLMGPLAWPGDGWSGGVAFYTQGGAGATFENITRITSTAETLNQFLATEAGPANVPVFGESRRIREDVFAEFGYVKLSGGLAKELGRLRIGAAVDIGYSQTEIRITNSDPTGSFELPGSGVRFQSDPAWNLGGKIGLSYDLAEHWELAYVYKTPQKIPLDGTLSSGAGDPRFYTSNRASGSLGWPAIHGAGAAYRMGPWLLGFDFEYLQYSSAFTTITLTINEPWIDTGFGFRTNQLPINANWRDQYVYKLGAEYNSGDWQARIGYNYGESPVPQEGVSPLLPGILEHFVSIGAGYTFEDGSQLDVAVMYAAPVTSEGGFASDWALLHAVFGGAPADIRLAQYDYSLKGAGLIAYLSWKYKI